MKSRPRIGFITLAVQDLRRSIDFYGGAFEFPTAEVEVGSGDHCLVQLEDDFALVLFRREDFLPLTAQPNEAKTLPGSS